MENNEFVNEDVTDVVEQTGEIVSNNRGISAGKVAGAALGIGLIGYGAYRLVKFIKRKIREKKANEAANFDDAAVSDEEAADEN